MLAWSGLSLASSILAAVVAGQAWADGFGFVRQPLEGNGSITAKVTRRDDFHAWGGAGVMVRDEIKPPGLSMSADDSLPLWNLRRHLMSELFECIVKSRIRALLKE